MDAFSVAGDHGCPTSLGWSLAGKGMEHDGRWKATMTARHVSSSTMLGAAGRGRETDRTVHAPANHSSSDGVRFCNNPAIDCRPPARHWRSRQLLQQKQRLTGERKITPNPSKSRMNVRNETGRRTLDTLGLSSTLDGGSGDKNTCYSMLQSLHTTGPIPSVLPAPYCGKCSIRQLLPVQR